MLRYACCDGYGIIAQVRADGKITGRVSKAALDLLNIDAQGLDDLDRTRIIMCD